MPQRMEPPQCFPTNANGVEIVEFGETEAAEDNSVWLVIHLLWNTTIGILSVLINLLLIRMIRYRSREQLEHMRPVLFLGAALDLCLSILNLFVCPLIITGYGRFVVITNSELFAQMDKPAINLITGVAGATTITAWGTVPIQFLYRYHLLKRGEPPRGYRMLSYAMILVIGGLLATLNSMRLYFHTDVEFRAEATLILRNSGLHVSPVNIHGGSLSDYKFKFYNINFAAFTFAGYVIVIYCGVQSMRYLRRMSMGRKTRRMNADMNRVLLALASVPLLCCVVPTVYISVSMMFCSVRLPASVFGSLLVVHSTLLNPIVTIYFIRPYRRSVKRWLSSWSRLPSTSATGSQTATVSSPLVLGQNDRADESGKTTRL